MFESWRASNVLHSNCSIVLSSFWRAVGNLCSVRTEGSFVSFFLNNRLRTHSIIPYNLYDTIFLLVQKITYGFVLLGQFTQINGQIPFLIKISRTKLVIKRTAFYRLNTKLTSCNFHFKSIERSRVVADRSVCNICFEVEGKVEHVSVIACCSLIINEFEDDVSLFCLQYQNKHKLFMRLIGSCCKL